MKLARILLITCLLLTLGFADDMEIIDEVEQATDSTPETDTKFQPQAEPEKNENINELG